VGLKRDTLVGGEREQLVIVHNGVHGLDPVSIEITIEDNPLGVGVSLLGEVTELAREETIDPFTGLDVHDTVELVGVDDLGVDVLDRAFLA
jgi:hypothetical protein